ncbi:hypothetical protein JOM56_001308, partial [Amanita muscaria]
AIEQDEEVTWVSENGKLVLPLCIEGRHPFTASAAGGGPTYVQSQSVPVDKPVAKDATKDEKKQELIALLNVPEHLTDIVKNAGLRVYYHKYKACLQAQELLTQKIKQGSWPAGVKKPTQTEIIELFVSKSSWHKYLTKAFHDISHYPVLKSWLEEEVGAPTDAEVWGVTLATYGFAELEKEKERRQQQNKNKGKAK